MDTATFTAAVLATFLLLATMMIQPAAAEHGIESDDWGQGAVIDVAPEPERQEPVSYGRVSGDTGSNDLVSTKSTRFEPVLNRVAGAPMALATPDGGPGQFDGMELETSDIVMTGGGPGASSTPFEFHLENVNR